MNEIETLQLQVKQLQENVSRLFQLVNQQTHQLELQQRQLLEISRKANSGYDYAAGQVQLNNGR